MDLAFRDENVSFPEKLSEILNSRFLIAGFLQSWAAFCRVLRPLFLMVCVCLLGSSWTQWAVATPLHATGDLEKWDRKKQEVELFGHASVSQPGETITADYIFLNQNTRILDAKGNCIYVTGDTVVYGDEMHINLETRTGTILNGRITSERFSLTGQRINKLGDRRYQARWGEYSTCRDCPASWSLLAENIDMEMEGYAFLVNVFGKLKSAPALWAPVLIFPLKTQRQTGFLSPRYSLGEVANRGFVFGLPFFWAIARNLDLMVIPGFFSARGFRWETEFRWIPFSNGETGVKLNWNGLVDSKLLTESGLGEGTRVRWGLSGTVNSPLPWGFSQMLVLNEMSDSIVPSQLGDTGGVNESFASSRWDIKKHFDFGGSLGLNIQKVRNRAILSHDPSVSVFRFDQKTVQALPSVSFFLNERSFFGLPVYGGLRLGAFHFYRPDTFFDYDPSRVFPGDTPASGLSYLPGVDPLRKAYRFNLNPALYSAFSVFGLLSVTPSIEGVQTAYVFPGAEMQNSNGTVTGVPPLLRSYFKLKLDLSTQLERVYSTPWVDSPRVKHLIRPFVGYSYIPTAGALYQVDPTHPFSQQIARSQYYSFDSSDLIPLSASGNSDAYLLPEGSALTYGVSTRLIRRVGALNAKEFGYEPTAELWLFQVLDLLEFQKPEAARRPFSRFVAEFSMRIQTFRLDFINKYYPYKNPFRNQFDVWSSYVLENSVRYGVLQFTRSFDASYSYDRTNCDGTKVDCGTSLVSLGTTFSVSESFIPSAAIKYDLQRARLQTASGGLIFQSASRCWRIALNVGVDVLGNTGVTWRPNFELNLTGSGFGDVQKTALGVVGGQITP
jgi:LPS-assembly protein